MLNSGKLKGVAIGFIAIYIIGQFIMPKVGLSLVLNFDTSCYSGAFSYIEKIGAGSCGAGQPGLVGFPFAINFNYNTKFQQLLTLLIDAAPLGVALVVLGASKRKVSSVPDDEHDSK